MPDLKNSLGWQYIQKTKFSRENIYTLKRPRIYPSAPFKFYPDAETYDLPVPCELNTDLISLIATRRSHREFKKTGH